MLRRIRHHVHHRQPHGDRQRRLPAVEVGRFRDDRRELIHRDVQERRHFDLDDRAHPDHRGTRARTDVPILGKRGVAHPLVTKFIHEHSVLIAGRAEDVPADVEPHDEGLVVALQFFALCLDDRVEIAHCAH